MQCSAQSNPSSVVRFAHKAALRLTPQPRIVDRATQHFAGDPARSVPIERLGGSVLIARGDLTDLIIPRLSDHWTERGHLG